MKKRVIIGVGIILIVICRNNFNSYNCNYNYIKDV